MDTTTDVEQPPTSENDPDELPSDGAPKVENPLDTSKFQQDPCQSLTATQSQGLDLGSAGKPIGMPLGNACNWRNEQTRNRAQIGFLDKDPRGLSSEYRAEKNGNLELFDELPPIEGFPAVVRGTIDDRDYGGCTVVVGASDEIAFEVIRQIPRSEIGQKEPCEAAAEVAAVALQTMKQG